MSMIDFHDEVFTLVSCGWLCHEDPQCRTLIFDFPKCRLYEGARHTGQLVVSPSTSSIVGEIVYDNVGLSSMYNQTCDHCASGRNLVCRANRCQCPANTYWNGENQCLNQRFVDPPSSCESNEWCRQDMNMICRRNRCQCSTGTFWYDQTCIPQYAEGQSCNSSNQCQNYLEMVCSRVNKTCIREPSKNIIPMNASLPARFANISINFNNTGQEWWRAFDNISTTAWNANPAHMPTYLYLTFDDEYLLTSLQLTVIGDTTHDPKFLDFFLDENVTALADIFSFPVAPSYWYTFPIQFFNYTYDPIVAKQIVINITRWTSYQVWLCELGLFGIPY